MSDGAFLYPAVIEHTTDGFSIYFPDLPGTAVLHSSESHAILNAKSLLISRLVELAYKNEQLPSPTPAKDIELYNSTDRIVYIECNILPYLEGYKNKSVTVNCTVPMWMRDAGKELGINFSLVLQQGLRDALKM
ncbi:putative RNase H-like HicB family nuclease [Paenibacillus sp. LBL]|uniref:type II toxin-antitoxin system HicB family antitoxin n=1 Tax=Paenibacillus sp. LBL TaxID=2940563 RepID=UPI0024731C30|nr:type II toxin-antitoxin system HicB family antitoxin [Paenibacillus sp. LBL]MDH6674256.1 putative RNase H-like HicB family nuclease [Paenibacillus sp. LBL]